MTDEGINECALTHAVCAMCACLLRCTPEFLVSGASSPFSHLAPIRLGDLGPLKIVLPMMANARRQRIETYLSVTGAVVARRIELDTMLGALDLVKKTDWVTILPGLMIAADVTGAGIKINPLIEPTLDLDLALIQPARQVMSRPAVAFLDLLKAQPNLLSDELAARSSCIVSLGLRCSGCTGIMNIPNLISCSPGWLLSAFGGLEARGRVGGESVPYASRQRRGERANDDPAHANGQALQG